MIVDIALREPAPRATFERLSADGQIAFQRCDACAGAIFYPRVLCPACGSTDLSWHLSAGTGEVYSVSQVHTRNETYDVALVDLDEGFRVMTASAADRPLRIGERVRARTVTLQVYDQDAPGITCEPMERS